MVNKFIPLLMIFLIFNNTPSEAAQFFDEKEIYELYSSLSYSLNQDSEDNKLVYKHIVGSISNDGKNVTFHDGLTVSINWWYRSVPQEWKAGDHVYITYDFSYHQLKLVHGELNTAAWGMLASNPSQLWVIKGMPNGPSDPDAHSLIILDNGYVFKSITQKAFGNSGWKVKDRTIILANSKDRYQIWNIDKKQIIGSEFIANKNQTIKEPIEIKNILDLENRLNAKVLQQPEATKALMSSLLNYTAGLKEKGPPIGVFLFIGPTGVGKTELAKTLANEMYEGSNQILRFDMSHFTESHSISRLIGSQPGYVNHEEGGQLTNPLLNNSQIVVLLDEIEKAHPQVVKTFLPVFDEGFILDTKNNQISCSETLFIMTSNLCSNEIVELHNQGYHSEDILAAIEPFLMQALSPELYNRVEPVLFMPIAKETMESLVDLMLERVTKRVVTEKEIQIFIDPTLKEFLVENGYHPLLGARPLKKLIEKRVLTTLAYTIISKGVEKGNNVLLRYDAETDSVIVEGLASLATN